MEASASKDDYEETENTHLEDSMKAAMEASASKDDYEETEETENTPENAPDDETTFFEQLDETIKEGEAAIEQGNNFVKDKEPANPKRKLIPVTVQEAPKQLRKSPRRNKGTPAKKLGD